MAEASSSPLSLGRRHRPALVFIFITIVLDVLALGIIIPVFPTLIAGFFGGDAGEAAEMLGLFGTLWAAMQFVCSPVLGALSDRFGRRPVILLSNLGLGLDYLVMALAPNLAWLFMGRMISGITAASFTTAGAYIADVTPPERRAAGFGLQGAAFGIGFVLGPALGGVLGSVDPRLPFWVAGGLSLANAVYGFLILPESLPPEQRRSFSWRRANPLGSLALLRSHAQLLGLAAVMLLSYLAHEALPAAFVLYTGYRYGWDERTVGLTLAGVGVCSAIVQGGLVRPIVARVGERRTLLAALLFGAAGFAVFGFAPSGAMLWLGIPVMALWGLFGPAAQSLMTRRVGPSEQGQLQGAIHGLRGISGLIGPGLFTLTFAFAIGAGQAWHLPGAPFLLAAGLLAGGVLLAWRVTLPGRA
jgi:DHA1 family tetracycline resistance protein-like MFS transporter